MPDSPDHDVPEWRPATPISFSILVHEGTSNLEARVADARGRWLREWMAAEEARAPRREWRWATPGWVSWGLGPVLTALGVVLLATAPLPDPPERDVFEVPVPSWHGHVVHFANHATASELTAAGVYRRGVRSILEHRPFSTLEALDGAPGIGRKTLRTLRRAAKPAPGG